MPQMMQTMFQPMLNIKGVEVDPDEQTFRVKAAGGGLAAMLGMGSKATISMDANGFRLKKTSFAMDEDTYVPRSKIAASVCVVTKPMELLVLGLATLVFFGLGLIFLIAFFLAKKRVIIGVLTNGGTVESLKLKAKGADLEDIKEGMRLVEEMITAESSGGGSGGRSSSPPPPPVESRKSRSLPASDAGGSFITSCPSCGTQMNVPAAAAGRKVRCTSCREVFQVPAE